MQYNDLKKLLRQNYRGTIMPEMDALLQTLAPILDPRFPIFIERIISILILWGEGDEPLENYKGLSMSLLDALTEAKPKGELP